MANRRLKPNWTKPSVNKQVSAPRAVVSASSLSPWAQQEDDIIEDFERNLQMMETTVAQAPWEEGSRELRAYEEQKVNAQSYKLKSLFDEDPSATENQELQRQRAKDYKFKSMFEAPPMSEKEKKMLDEYHMNPPFLTEYNRKVVDSRPKKKVVVHDRDPRASTARPWEIGAMSSEAVSSCRTFDRPATALWDAPPKETVAGASSSFVSSGDPILDSLRRQLLLHGAVGIHGLSRKFRMVDDDGSGTLDQAEFVKGMRELNVEYNLTSLNDKALKHLFSYFDKDDSGFISYNEFLVGIRGVLNPRRKEMVRLAFQQLDRDKSGTAELQEIKGKLNLVHPDVVDKRRSEEQVLLEFMDSFRASRDKSTGIITLDEFEQYYANLSASIDNDDYFELMVRNAWHISGGTGWSANSSNRRVLVTDSEGRQTVEEIKNDLGLAANDKKGAIDRLKAQGVVAASINTNGIGGIDNQFEDRSSGSTRQSSGPSSERYQRGNPPKDSDNANSNRVDSRSRRLSDYASGTAPVKRNAATAVNNSSKHRSEHTVKPMNHNNNNMSLSNFYKNS